MASAREWIEGARPRTLPASISPVIAGAGVACFANISVYADWDSPIGEILILFVMCLIVGLGIQIGSNYGNDYSDGIRGTDEVRVGPMRLVGSGAATPAAVKRASLVSFAIACVTGLVVVGLASDLFSPQAWRDFAADPNANLEMVIVPAVLVLVGLACVLAAWFYTGGKHPYGYAGLGEVFVFVFYGLVATVGTAFVQAPRVCGPCDLMGPCPCHHTVPWGAAILAGVAMGAICTDILVANNLRDLAHDEKAHKITLSVRLGDARTRVLYIVLLGVAALAVVGVAALTTWYVLLGLIGVGLLGKSVAQVASGATGKDLIDVLKWTGISELATAVLMAAGLAIGAVYA